MLTRLAPAILSTWLPRSTARRRRPSRSSTAATGVCVPSALAAVPFHAIGSRPWSVHSCLSASLDSSSSANAAETAGRLVVTNGSSVTVESGKLPG
jgi:hypothetical protein